MLHQPGGAMHHWRSMFDQRAPVGVHAGGARHLTVEQLDYATPPAADVEHPGGGVNVLADGRFVDLPALAPARMGGGVAPSKDVLTIEV
jgi:hypothetical protein